MAWWMAIPTIAGAYMGAKKAERQGNDQRNFNLAQSELTRYSPWTGMKGQLDTSSAPSQLEGGFAGGVQGLGMAQSLGGAFGSKPASPTAGMDQGQQSVYNGLLPQNQSQEAFSQPTFFGNNTRRNPFAV